MELHHKVYSLVDENGSSSLNTNSIDDIFIVIEGILTNVNISSVFIREPQLKRKNVIIGYSILEHFILKENFLISNNDVKISLFDKKNGINLFITKIRNAILMFNDVIINEEKEKELIFVLKDAYKLALEEIEKEKTSSESQNPIIEEELIDGLENITGNIEFTDEDFNNSDESIPEETVAEETVDEEENTVISDSEKTNTEEESSTKEEELTDDEIAENIQEKEIQQEQINLESIDLPEIEEEKSNTEEQITIKEEKKESKLKTFKLED